MKSSDNKQMKTKTDNPNNLKPLNQVKIFDSTLRDGEQSPGASMNVLEKLLVASQLEQLGVDVIEAGFPASSNGDFESVRRIADTVQKCEVAALCRTREQDIRIAWEAIRNANLPTLHVFIATSDLHLERKLKMSRQEVLDEIQRGVGLCSSLCPRVEFSAEDATRTDLEYLKAACKCAIDAGATVINIPDTVGYTLPEEYIRIIKSISEVIGNRPVTISTHCHNDLGLAVANSLAAVSAGARQIECCINGIGERAGNAALEEIVMALNVRFDLLKCTTRIDTSRIFGTSRLVSELTGFSIQPNKAIVGRNAFAHEAGIHQHAMLNDARTYEIMRPEDIGVPKTNLVLGKHSGRAALRDRLASYGYTLDGTQLDRVFLAFKNLADKKKLVFDEDILALVTCQMTNGSARYRLEDIELKSGNTATPWARATLWVDGDKRSVERTGDGPVHAAIEAIKQCVGRDSLFMSDYQLSAVTSGSDAQGRVSMTVSENGSSARGQATHTDVVVASAQAFVQALNQLALRQIATQQRKVS